MINAAVDWGIIDKGKQCAIIDRCVLQKVTPQEINKLNQKYAFVVPLVLLMESCYGKSRRRFLITYKRLRTF